MEAFKSTYNLTIDARSLVVRFRRNKGSVGLSEKGKKTKKVSYSRSLDGTENDVLDEINSMEKISSIRMRLKVVLMVMVAPVLMTKKM